MPALQRIQIKSNDRVFICGSTGSGKTVYGNSVLIPQYSRVIFHDFKLENADLLSAGFVLARTTDEMMALMVGNSYKILYQPLMYDEDGNLADFNRVCEIIYKNGNCTLFVDEANYFATSSSIEPYHRELLTRGRSRGCGVVNLSQRPVGVHNLCISEAQHLIIFNLNLENDILKLKAALPRDMHDKLYNLNEFEYIYSGTNRIRRVCKPVRML